MTLMTHVTVTDGMQEKRMRYDIRELLAIKPTRNQLDTESFNELLLERSAIMSVECDLSMDVAEGNAWQDVRSIAVDRLRAPVSLELLPMGAECIYCGSRFVVEIAAGLECWECRRMAWVDVDNGIVRADFVEIELGKQNAEIACRGRRLAMPILPSSICGAIEHYSDCL